MSSSYSSRVTAVVAGLALAGGIALSAPQTAYAAENVGGSADAQKLEQLVAQAADAASDSSAVVYETSTTYEAPTATFVGDTTETEDTTEIDETNNASGETDSEQEEGTEDKQDESTDETETPESEDEETDGSEEEKTDTVEETPEAKPATQELVADEAEVETQASVTYNKNSWTKVGDKYYWSDDGKSARKGWLVTATATSGSKGELQRYWLTSDGSLAISSLIDAKDAGYWAYATKYGYVVRGKYTEGNNIYLADNDGKLENTGWLVTGNYTGGELERYYIESSTHSAVKGRSTSGYAHYTTSEGYVVRGSYDDGNGRVWLADNDGKLESQTGWMVTGKYTNGELQRYYMCSGNYQGSAKSSRFTAKINNKESVFFGQGGVGYVVRGYGFGLNGSDYVYADNEGRLTASNWLVTGYWTGGELQRYWFDSTGTVARNRRISQSETKSYAAYATSNGYVVRGAYDDGCGRVWLADNDGKLETRTGWLVTGNYTNGELQRYYMNSGSTAGSAKSSYFTATIDGKTSTFFGQGGVGYVFRGTLTWGDHVMLSDNEGRLETQKGWLVTGKYTNGELQRYYMETISDLGNTLGAKTGVFAVSGAKYYGLSDVGYVLRGKTAYSSHFLLANNDGKIESAAGWLKTSYYDGTEHKYWLETIADSNGLVGAKTGKFTVDGKNYYGRTDTGYVATGVYVVSNYYTHPSGFDGGTEHTDTIVVADSEGVLQNRSYVAKLLVSAAYTQVGYSYSYDDSAYYPYNSFNCSGFSWWVYYKALGINLSHNQGYYSYYANQNNTTDSQSYGVMKRGGWKTSVSSLVPGDLVFFSPVGSRYYTGHVGVYVGNGKMIDSYPSTGVSVRSVYAGGNFVGGGFPITLIS